MELVNTVDSIVNEEKMPMEIQCPKFSLLLCKVIWFLIVRIGSLQ
jgi:hypothetical protein